VSCGNGITPSRDGVNRRQNLDQLVPKLQSLAHLDFMKADKGRLWRWNASEIGPDDIIKNMHFQSGDGGSECMNLQRRRAPGGSRVHHQGQGKHVVQVRVREQDLLNAAHFVRREVTDPSTGVNQHVPINQE
jgi:hypothetical protein